MRKILCTTLNDKIQLELIKIGKFKLTDCNEIDFSTNDSLHFRSIIIAEQAANEIAEKYSELFKEVSLGSSHLYEPEIENQPLDEDKYRKVCDWISGLDTEEILNGDFSLVIKRYDIKTLFWDPPQWLNDKVINVYMELLTKRSLLNKELPKVYAMNTNFFSSLQRDYSCVRSWTNKNDIFSFDLILVPVHKDIHWGLAIIDLRNKTIKYYDSMGASNKVVLNELVEYLKSESLEKKQTAFDMSDWSIENAEHIPLQSNGSDCGVFCCMYAEFATRNRKILFTQENILYFRIKIVYEICTGILLT